VEQEFGCRVSIVRIERLCDGDEPHPVRVQSQG
jgi:hypothetical protein